MSWLNLIPWDKAALKSGMSRYYVDMQKIPRGMATHTASHRHSAELLGGRVTSWGPSSWMLSWFVSPITTVFVGDVSIVDGVYLNQLVSSHHHVITCFLHDFIKFSNLFVWGPPGRLLAATVSAGAVLSAFQTSARRCQQKVTPVTSGNDCYIAIENGPVEMVD